MSDKNAVSIIITGRVQGVFFRAHTRETATSLDLQGWVKNLSNGSVQALFQGEQQNLELMVDWCRQGPPQSMVETVTAQGVPVDPGLTDFTVLY